MKMTTGPRKGELWRRNHRIFTFLGTARNDSQEKIFIFFVHNSRSAKKSSLLQENDKLFAISKDDFFAERELWTK